jgi:hypothetical protein
MTPNNTRVNTITHNETRANILSAELEPQLRDDDKAPIRVACERRTAISTRSSSGGARLPTRPS